MTVSDILVSWLSVFHERKKAEALKAALSAAGEFVADNASMVICFLLEKRLDVPGFSDTRYC